MRRARGSLIPTRGQRLPATTSEGSYGFCSARKSGQASRTRYGLTGEADL
jgi:hypothetical protein